MALTFNIFNYSKELRRIVTDLESPLKTRRRERKMSQSMATLSESPSLKRDSSSAKQKHPYRTRSIMASENDICCVCWALKVRHVNGLCTSECQVRDELTTFLFCNASNALNFSFGPCVITHFIRIIIHLHCMSSNFYLHIYLIDSYLPTPAMHSKNDNTRVTNQMINCN